MSDFTKDHRTFLNTNELAARHRRNPKTLRNDRVLGAYVPFHVFGQLVRYRFSDVFDYEQAQRVVCGDEKNGLYAKPTVDPRAETLLTPRELAERHQREEKPLRNDRAQRSYISYYKLGGPVRYALSDVLAYEAAHRATSTTSEQSRDKKVQKPSRSNPPQEERPNDL